MICHRGASEWWSDSVHWAHRRASAPDPRSCSRHLREEKESLLPDTRVSSPTQKHSFVCWSQTANTNTFAQSDFPNQIKMKVPWSNILYNNEQITSNANV